MTIFLVLIIIFCFALLGYKLSVFYINRKKFFSEMQLLMSSIELDVRFSQDKLQNIIKSNCSNINSKELCCFCEMYYDALLKKQNKLSNLISRKVLIFFE